MRNRFQFGVWILFLLLTLSASSIQCNSNMSISKEIKWLSGEFQLYGTLLLPDNSVKSLIILIHGAGNGDRSLRLYSTHAQRLVEMGTAVFYYDKRGTGKSEGDWKKATFKDLASDAIRVIPKLLEFSELENAKIGFMGFSQGGWINLIAKEQFPETAFLMSISGSVKTPEEQARHINRTMLERLGYSDLLIHQKVDSIDKVISSVYRTNSGWEEAEAFLKPYKSESWFIDLGLGLQPKDSWNWEWYGKLPSNFDPDSNLKKLEIPLFAAHGGKDPLVDGSASLQYLEYLKSQGKNITNYFDPNGPHVLKYKKSYLIFWKRSYWKDDYWKNIKSWLSKEQLI